MKDCTGRTQRQEKKPPSARQPGDVPIPDVPGAQGNPRRQQDTEGIWRPDQDQNQHQIRIWLPQAIMELKQGQKISLFFKYNEQEKDRWNHMIFVFCSTVKVEGDRKTRSRGKEGKPPKAAALCSSNAKPCAQFRAEVQIKKNCLRGC